MAEVVAAVDDGFRLKGAGLAEVPPKPTMDGRSGAFSQVMAASVRGLGLNGVKWISAVPANRQRGLPQMHATMLLFDEDTGRPAAVMEAGLVTELRTGASVAVAATYLAREGSEKVGILGCGLQARPSLRALAIALPDLREVCCFDISRTAMTDFIAELERDLPNVSFTTCEGPAGVATGADVVVTAIRGDPDSAPLGEGLLKPGRLAVAIDWDQAWTAEAMAGCDRFVCDDAEQVRATKAAGVRLRHVPARIDAELGDIVAGGAPGRSSEDERIFCLNMGLAIEDLMVAKVVVDKARASGVGVQLLS
jgi:alanine dehydrogenase